LAVYWDKNEWIKSLCNRLIDDKIFQYQYIPVKGTDEREYLDIIFSREPLFAERG